MKPKGYRITGIPSNLLTTDKSEKINDYNLACMLVASFKTEIGQALYILRDQLN